MIEWLMPVITILCAVIASGGFWAWLQYMQNKRDAKSKMILGLGHDRILYLCMRYIEQDYITSAELENLHKYLYAPYSELGGNGTVSRLMKQVDSLEIRNGPPKSKEKNK